MGHFDECVCHLRLLGCENADSAFPYVYPKSVCRQYFVSFPESVPITIKVYQIVFSEKNAGSLYLYAELLILRKRDFRK